MIAAVKASLCWLYGLFEHLWSPLVKRREQVLVRFVDLFWSQCVYCLAYRMLALGVGVGLVISGSWKFGAMLIVAVFLLVLVERVACDIKARD